MSNFKSSNFATEFIDYIPAKLSKNKEWRVVYYAKIPTKNEMKRFRLRVPKAETIRERDKLGRKMVLSVNRKLESGWSPFYEDKTHQYKSIDDIFNSFISITNREVEDGIKRKDTLRSYASYLKLFSEFLKKNRPELKFLLELDIYVINAFLDYVYMERRVSPRTYNNYLRFLFTFFEFCLSKGFLKQNPVEGIKKKPQPKKKRTPLRAHEKEQLKIYGKENKAYFTLCMLTYYCFVRRTELTKLKVSAINLIEGKITILGEISKNKKTERVTIPNAFLPLLVEHLKNANNSDYLFSKNGFKTGNEQLAPKKVSDEWAKFRKKHKINNKYQFYSLKDTGITDLLNSGIPSIKVRDQARHHDLKMTETYTSRSEGSDEIVQNAIFQF